MVVQLRVTSFPFEPSVGLEFDLRPLEPPLQPLDVSSVKSITSADNQGESQI